MTESKPITSHSIIQILEEHEKEVMNRFDVRKIGIFGSYARGDEVETSDIDILVEFEKSTFDNYFDLLFYLEKLFGKSVDLVTSRGISQYIRPYVEEEVVWCGYE